MVLIRGAFYPLLISVQQVCVRVWECVCVILKNGKSNKHKERIFFFLGNLGCLKKALSSVVESLLFICQSRKKKPKTFGAVCAINLDFFLKTRRVNGFTCELLNRQTVFKMSRNWHRCESILD